MRIDNSIRGVQVANRSAQRPKSGAFELEGPATAQRSLPAAAPPSAGGINALLALQAVDDPLLAKRKAVRRGSALLDALDGARTDLLAGDVGEGRLNQMTALVTQARESVEPGLDGVLDDIELRVRVELAKRGRFPT